MGGNLNVLPDERSSDALRLLPSPPGAEAYLALDKPAGRVVHGPAGLLGALRRAHGDDLALVHRLDRETAGVLLLARGAEALAAAHAAWPRDVTKTYLALTRGVPSPREGAVEAPLLEHRTSRPELLRRALRAAYGAATAERLLRGERVAGVPPLPPPARTAAHPAGRPAVTRYRVLEDDGETALVELVPKQGRMHQIRVHLLALETPLLGDPLYDAARTDETPPFLLAASLAWQSPPHAPDGTIWTWRSSVSPPPVRTR